MRLPVTERLGQDLAGLAQQFRDGFRARHDGKEIRVPRPARHDVLMQVSGDSGTRDRALVHPQVKALRRFDLANNLHSMRGQLAEFDTLSKAQIGVVRNVPVRQNQNMAGIVGKQVHHHEAGLAPIHNQVLFVVPFRALAKRTRLYITMRPIVDLHQSVRRPQALQSVSLRTEVFA